jgi:Tfp pilus assembly protein PilV
LDSETRIIFSKSESKSSLFNQELTVFRNNQRHAINNDMDKWITLIAGNLLQCNSTGYFNSRLKNPTNILSMIRDWNYSNQQSAPKWAKQHFNGINSNNPTTFDLSNSNLSALNFSNSNLENIRFNSTDLSSTNFTNCNFFNVNMIDCNISGADFTGVNIVKPKTKSALKSGLMIGHSRISYNVTVPDQLANHLLRVYGSDSMFVNSSNRPTYIGNDISIAHTQANNAKEYYHWFSVKDIFKPLEGLLQIGLKADLFDKTEIKSWFSYESDKTKESAEILIDSL